MVIVKKPLLICLSSTRNYSWVTNAFLKANSLWADYIILVDQMSTDGTREMALSNPKVILIDNEDLTYSETKRSELAINRAREIQGDKILIYLAIDEVLPANLENNKNWKEILSSKPGEVFCFEWANLHSDKKHYITPKGTNNTAIWMARGFHDDGTTPYNNQGLDMHTHCIPYPVKPIKETLVSDFKILHFAVYSQKWNEAKQRFYQFVDFDKNKRSIIQLSRMYKKNEQNNSKEILPLDWIHTKDNDGFNLFDEILDNNTPLFDKYVLDFIAKNGIDYYKKLDIWDKKFIENNRLIDARSTFQKIIHLYLKTTRNISGVFLFKIIDKILKKII